MIKETIQKYKLIIADGKIEEAFKLLISDNAIPSNSKNEILLLASTFKEFRRKEILGIEEDDNSYNRITFSLLELLTLIEEGIYQVNTPVKDYEIVDESEELNDASNNSKDDEDLFLWKADKSGYYFFVNGKREKGWANIIDGKDLVLYREINKKAYRLENYVDEIKKEEGKLKLAVEEEYLNQHTFLWKANKDGFGFYVNFKREKGSKNIIDGDDLLIFRVKDGNVYRFKGYKNSKAINENKLKIAEVDLTYSR